MSATAEYNKHRFNSISILEKYTALCNTESDINEHLPILYTTACACMHITEFGVRRPTSTYAFLASGPVKLISYDIGKYPEVDEIDYPGFEFHQQNVLDIEIEPTDFLFIDTYHTYTQLTRELQLHAGKVRKYIAFHDTERYKEVGEDWYPGVSDHMNCNNGIYKGITEFLDAHPEWIKIYEVTNNNGLIIIKHE